LNDLSKIDTKTEKEYEKNCFSVDH